MVVVSKFASDYFDACYMRDGDEDKISLDRIFLTTTKIFYVKKDSFTCGLLCKLSVE
jgi:hypothetical protein